MDLINEIQADLISQNVNLSDILRKAKAFAYRIKNTNLINWVNQELNGYKLKTDLPDYRILRTFCFGKWTNGAWLVSGRQVPMYQIEDDKIIDILTRYPIYDGVKSIEQLSKKEGGHFVLSPAIVSVVNEFVQDNGYAYMDLEMAISPHDFDQIMDTVKNRLQDFLLELGQNWDSTQILRQQEMVNNLISVYIYNNQSQGANMPTVFDQRGQQLNNQYNSAGNMVVGIENKASLLNELENIHSEIENKKNSNLISRDLAIEVQYKLLQANKEAQKPSPNLKVFVDYLKNAKDLLSGVAALVGIVNAISNIISLAQKILV